MNTKFLVPLGFLTALSLAGCGQTKTDSASSSPSVQSASSPASDGPTLVADQPKDDSSKKKKKHPVKPMPQAPAQQPVAQAPVSPSPQFRAVAQPTLPVAVEIPKPNKPYVIGMRTQSKTAAALFEKGTSWAISDAKVCAGFGFINNGASGGSKCFLDYSDGTTKPADYYNRADAFAYVDQLTKQLAAENQAKADKKAAKKRKNKE